MGEPLSFKHYQIIASVGLLFLVVLGLVLSALTGITVTVEALAANIVGSLPGIACLLVSWLATRQVDMSARFERFLPTLHIIGYAIILYFLFPVIHTVPTMILATFGGPLWDSQLAALDAVFGIHVGELVAWASAHPTLNFALNTAYGSVYFQYALVFGALVLLRNFRGIWETIAVLIWGSIAGLLLFVAIPVEGPFAYFELPHSAGQAAVLEAFRGLRAQEITTITHGLGIVAFPSFHVFFALNLTWAVRTIKPLLVLLIVLNTFNIMATMTTGWHFFGDVAAGFVLFGLMVWLVTTFEQRLRTRAGPSLQERS